MRTYYQLDCPVLEQIQKETLDYIQTKTNLLEHVDQFWNKINNVEFITMGNETVYDGDTILIETIDFNLKVLALIMIGDKPIELKITNN